MPGPFAGGGGCRPGSFVRDSGQPAASRLRATGIFPRGPLDLVGLVARGLPSDTDNSPQIVRLWDEFFRTIVSLDVVSYGVSLPALDGRFDYLAGVERHDAGPVRTDTSTLHLNAREYAVFPHHEAAGSIADAYRAISARGREVVGRAFADNRPSIEVYPPSAWGREVAMQIWVPVRHPVAETSWEGD